MTTRLTERQIDALLACYEICAAGEWPFERPSREVAARAARKLRDLLPNEPIALGDDP